MYVCTCGCVYSSCACVCFVLRVCALVLVCLCVCVVVFVCLHEGHHVYACVVCIQFDLGCLVVHEFSVCHDGSGCMWMYLRCLRLCCVLCVYVFVCVCLSVCVCVCTCWCTYYVFLQVRVKSMYVVNYPCERCV